MKDFQWNDQTIVFAKEQRLREVEDAIRRYRDQDLPVLREWEQERIDLHQWFKDRSRQKPQRPEWTDDLVREYGEFYRKHQGKGTAGIWGRDCLEVFFEQKEQAKKAERDWEIVELKDVVGGDLSVKATAILEHDNWEDYVSHRLSAKNATIHKVKRLSDGETFSVGDKVVHKDGSYTSKIFVFCNEHINWFYFEEDKTHVKDLNNFKKLPPLKEEHHFDTAFSVKDRAEGETTMAMCTCTGEEHDQKCPYRAVGDTVHITEKWFEPTINALFRDKPEQPKRIEVRLMCHDCSGNDPRWISFITSECISSEKFPLLKKAIESVLNDEPAPVTYGLKETIHTLKNVIPNIVGANVYNGVLPLSKKLVDAVVAIFNDYNTDIVGLLRDCVSSTWGNPSLTDTQKLFDQFLEERKLIQADLNKFITKKVNEVLLDKKYTQADIDKAREAAFYAACAGRTNAWETAFPTFNDYLNSLK